MGAVLAQACGRWPTLAPAGDKLLAGHTLLVSTGRRGRLPKVWPADPQRAAAHPHKARHKTTFLTHSEHRGFTTGVRPGERVSGAYVTHLPFYHPGAGEGAL